MDPVVQVYETFASIQGESTYAGCPCFFIRLAGCNLRCSYCDTPEAVAAKGEPRRVSRLADEYRASGLALGEVTGGEPLLQAGAADLLKTLQPLGTILVETNGSQDISVIPDGVVAIMDIKCPASGVSAAMDWRNLDRLRRADEVKFVIGDRRDYEWARQVLRERQLVSRCHAVLFSPAFPVLDPALLVGWLLEDRLPARLNLPLHKIVWGADRKGV